MELKDLELEIEQFCAEREWSVFHTPKNLAMALSVEAAELLELFQWLTPEQSVALPQEAQAKARDEIGDVMICLVNLAMKLGINPLEAAQQKLIKVRTKYPVEKARGLAKKYNELPE